jgi:low affinity Fe/Cu permease
MLSFLNQEIMNTNKSGITIKKFFEKFAARVTNIAGSTTAFAAAFGLIILWLISGPFFHYSEKWLLYFNTISDIIVFLMVFLLQKTQNKDSLAIQLKLNELLSSHEPASKELINAEKKTEDELRDIQKNYSEEELEKRSMEK